MSPVSVSSFPLSTYELLNVIGPTLRTLMSFVIDVFDAPSGKMRESPDAGAPAGDQLASFDQFTLAGPVHERVIARGGDETKQQTASRRSARRQPMIRPSAHRGR